MKRTVILSPAAQADLASLYDYIAEQASSAVALRYLDRIYKYCASFDIGAERGTRRDDLRAGLRTVGFERRVMIAFMSNRRPSRSTVFSTAAATLTACSTSRTERYSAAVGVRTARATRAVSASVASFFC